FPSGVWCGDGSLATYVLCSTRLSKPSRTLALLAASAPCCRPLLPIRRTRECAPLPQGLLGSQPGHAGLGWRRGSARRGLRCLPPRPPWSVVSLPLAGLVDRQRPSSQCRPVEPGDRRLGLGAVRHLDKTKAPRAAGFSVCGDLGAVDDAVGFEQLTQLVL